MTATKDIQLTREALRLLKRISQGKKMDWRSVEKSDAYKTLLYFSLISHPHGYDMGSVTERGKQVLLHYQSEDSHRKLEHRHDWSIAIFSTMGGALLSKPLWSLLECFIEWITQFL